VHRGPAAYGLGASGLQGPESAYLSTYLCHILKLGYVPEYRKMGETRQKGVFVHIRINYFSSSLTDVESAVASESNVNPSLGNVRRISGHYEWCSQALWCEE
jgi:hypothetical protein